MQFSFLTSLHKVIPGILGKGAIGDVTAHSTRTHSYYSVYFPLTHSGLKQYLYGITLSLVKCLHPIFCHCSSGVNSSYELPQGCSSRTLGR